MGFHTDQAGNDEIIMFCLSLHIYMTSNLEHINSKCEFPTLSTISEENGHPVNIV